MNKYIVYYAQIISIKSPVAASESSSESARTSALSRVETFHFRVRISLAHFFGVGGVGVVAVGACAPACIVFDAGVGLLIAMISMGSDVLPVVGEWDH